MIRNATTAGLLLVFLTACGPETAATFSAHQSAVVVPLSEVSAMSSGNQAPPIAAAHRRYQNTLISVEGVRLAHRAGRIDLPD